jgi:integrase
MLLHYRLNNITVPEKRITLWIQNAAPAIRKKLATVKLIDAPKTIQHAWNDYIKHKTDVKPITIQNYRHCQSVFLESFPPDTKLSDITTDQLLDWKMRLYDDYAPATVVKICIEVKAMLQWAVKQKWIADSPMQDVKTTRVINRTKDRIITMDEYERLLDACPNQEWRIIIAMARIGGLRCPSELKQLRWSDIKDDRFIVKSPKTERHAGQGTRIVPLFPELKRELDDRNGEYVIQSMQGTGWCISAPFQQIAKKAGLTIVRPFDNMRMTRSNEIRIRFGETKESIWLGHSTKVMKDFYANLSDEEYAEAVG